MSKQYYPVRVTVGDLTFFLYDISLVPENLNDFNYVTYLTQNSDFVLDNSTKQIIKARYSMSDVIDFFMHHQNENHTTCDLDHFFSNDSE
jgi:hypothetical protein